MAKGTGYVEQLPSGRYRARLPRWLGGDRQPGETFDEEDDAVAYLRAALDAAAAPKEKGTLRWWGTIWLQRREARGLSSFTDDAGRWRQHVAESDLADLRLGAIKPQHVAAFARWLSTRQTLRQVIGGGRERTGPVLSRQTQQHVLKLLDLALSDAVIEGLCSANAAAEIRVVPSDEGDDLEAWTWLTQPEIDRLLTSEAVPEEARLCYATAIYTGLRAGELWALTWDRVVLGERPHLLIARSNKRRSTKSGKPRAVPLLAPALEAVQELHQLRGEPSAGWVWPSVTGGQRDEGDDHGWADRSRGAQGVQRGHRSLAGIDRPVRFHDLRHTCASHLLQGSWGRRWRLEEVRDWLGHSSITVTQRYAHLCADHLHEAAAETRQPRTAPRTALRGAAVEGGFKSVGPVGFEPTTNGLKGRPRSEADQGVAPSMVRSWCGAAGAADVAQAVLTLAAAGQAVPGALLEALAQGVLDSPAVAAAEAVLEGGDHALDRAIGLAELVLGDQPSDSQRRSSERTVPSGSPTRRASAR